MLIFLFLSCVLKIFLFADEVLSWTEFDNNPVYTPYATASGLPDDYFPTVLFNPHQFDGNGDRVFYKMWHQSPAGVAYSTSNDGINWTLQSTLITETSYPVHPCVIYDKHGFGRSHYHYKMWIWTNHDLYLTPPNLAIHFYASADGIVWTLVQNPIFILDPPGTTRQDTSFYLANLEDAGISLFYLFAGFGQVFYNPHATSTPGKPFSFPYVAFYDTGGANIPPFTNQEAIGLAYSEDGSNWIRFGDQPIFIPSAAWDSVYAGRASILKVFNVYHMFFSGSPSIALKYGIGHATSLDGINWTEDIHNPIFTIEEQDSSNPTFTTEKQGKSWRTDSSINNSICYGRTIAPTVVVGPHPSKQSVTLQMWFSGGSNDILDHFSTAAIGYAKATLYNPHPPKPRPIHKRRLK